MVRKYSEPQERAKKKRESMSSGKMLISD
jgi:hypothetical protein